MTPEERDLIAGLFERMRNMGTIDKDREAEEFIARSARQVPDATYMLVQSVLVQELALQKAGAKSEELERRLHEHGRAQQGTAAASSGFLGSIFGGSRGEGRTGSVPAVGSRAGETAYDRPRAGAGFARRPGSAFGQQAAEAQHGGGGFLRGAMATAAGVAGGMLLADSIRGMLGGDAGKAQAAAGDDKSQSESARQEDQQQEPQYQDPDDNDPGNTQDASWGGDFGSDDFDI